MSGEAVPEGPIADAFKDYEVDVHGSVLDTIIENVKARFEKNGILYCKLVFLSTVQFAEKNTSLPVMYFKS